MKSISGDNTNRRLDCDQTTDCPLSHIKSPLIRFANTGQGAAVFACVHVSFGYVRHCSADFESATCVSEFVRRMLLAVVRSYRDIFCLCFSLALARTVSGLASGTLITICDVLRGRPVTSARLQITSAHCDTVTELLSCGATEHSRNRVTV